MKPELKKYIETKYRGYSKFEFIEDYKNMGVIFYKGEMCFGNWNSDGDIIFHRPIGPTMIKIGGNYYWYKSLFIKHRKDGATIIKRDGYKLWYAGNSVYPTIEEKYWNF